VNSQKAVLLSYKLFKIYFRGVDLNDPKGQEEYHFVFTVSYHVRVAARLRNVFIPYIQIMELHKTYEKVSDKISPKITKLATYIKIKKLLRK
jgi:hypothetical protein